MRKINRSWSPALFLFLFTHPACSQSVTAQTATKPSATSEELVQVHPNSTPMRTAPSDDQAATSAKQEFTLFERPGAPGKINPDKLRKSLELAAQELHTPTGALPRAIIYHINESEAELFGVTGTSIWRTLRSAGVRYEFWFVGEPTDETYSALAVVWLEHYFNVALTPVEGKRVVLVITKKLNGMVSAEELAHTKSPSLASLHSSMHSYVSCASNCSEKHSLEPCVP